jgi:hypothetical protein
MVSSTNPDSNSVIDLWEAWVDVQEHSLKPFTLYVVGEIYWDNRTTKPILEKIGSTKDGILHLTIHPGIICQEGLIREIRYSEPIVIFNQYTMVVIHAGKDVLCTMDIKEQVI